MAKVQAFAAVWRRADNNQKWEEIFMGNPSGVTQTTLLLLLGLSAISYPACAAEMSLAACPSDKTVIGGVNACGKVWKLGSGNAALSPDGKLVSWICTGLC